MSSGGNDWNGLIIVSSLVVKVRDELSTSIPHFNREELR